MAGYSGTPLIKKLGVKEGYRILLMNSPRAFLEELQPLPANVNVVKRVIAPLDLIMLFVDSKRILSQQFAKCASKLSARGMIWVAWPKKSSGVSTDLNFDVVQRIGLKAGLVDVKICAVDEVWSGLKFVYRLKDRPSS
jgi:hypothetical protein